MILSIEFKNFFSFKESGSITFEFDPKTPINVTKGEKYGRILGVKGANASGKTNVLRAVSFVSQFACHSFAYKPDTLIPFEKFFRSSDPTEFSVKLEINGTEFFYELSIDDRNVLKETIFKKISRKTKIIERVGDKIVKTSPEMRETETIRLKGNASLISTAHQYGIPAIKEIYHALYKTLSNVSYTGLEPYPDTEETASEFYFKNPAIFSEVKNFLLNCDIGLSNIEIFEEADGKNPSYYPIYYHGNNDRLVTSSTESSGTKSLYSAIGRYLVALKHGGLIVMDEFDNHLHPDILPKILALFDSEESNPRGARLIFSTHNNEIMDILGRYRTYLVNKRENESFIYRLDEIPGDILRNDRPISKVYREGKIGGIPRL